MAHIVDICCCRRLRPGRPLEFCYFFFKAWNVLPCVSPIISPSFQSLKPATEGWWDARGEDNIVQRQQWRQVLIFNSAELISVSHRPLGSPLSSLSSSSWSVVQVLLAGEKMMSAHAFLVFLGHLIFWMGMFKVFRWNGLEILIPKHMWKSIIGPLEQLKIAMGHFFGTPCRIQLSCYDS